MSYRKLNKEEERVLLKRGTEEAFTGKYTNTDKNGTYHSRQCDAPLYCSSDKFDSKCGWPSFDDEIDNAIMRLPDPDGKRTEIICSKCNGHLGHVFLGEKYTEKNTRHCVNSISMVFKKPLFEKAIFASGCFWGTQYHFEKLKGVQNTKVGYIGGHTSNPSYQDVCTGRTGHVEALQIEFIPSKVSYKELTKLFFETHDSTQVDGQGPDIGSQYRSEIFYFSDIQKKIAESLILILTKLGIEAVTKLSKASTFWSAEENHQHYYQKNEQRPYCHIYKKLF